MLRVIELVKRVPSTRLVRAMFTIGLLSFVARAVALTKEITVAWRFGTGSETEAYLVAMGFWQLLSSVAAGALLVLQADQYRRSLRRQRPGAITDGKLVVFGAAVIVGFTLLFTILAEHLVRGLAPGFDYGLARLTRDTFLLTAPWCVISTANTFLAGALNLREKFIPASIASAITPGVMIVVLVFGPSLSSLLALSAVIGAIVELFMLLIVTRSCNVLPTPDLRMSMRQVRLIAVRFISLTAGALIVTGNPLVDQIVASGLGNGSVAALGFGNRLVYVLLGLCSSVVIASTTPYLTRFLANHDRSGLENWCKRIVLAIMLTCLPIVVCLVMFSTPITRLVLERGVFTPQDTTIVSSIQAASVFQMPFFIVNSFLMRVIGLIKQDRGLVSLSLLGLLLNAALDVTLSRWIGVLGVAFASTLVYLVLSITCAMYLRRLLYRGTF